MAAFLIRRITYAVVMLVLVSFVSFLIIQLPPGDFLTQKIAELQARGDRSADARVEEYRVRYGLDQPLLTQYWIWASNFVQGDFGESFQYERPVAELLGQRLGLTVVLTIATIAVVWLIAIPLGVYSAVNQYSLGDQLLTTLSFLGLGMPGFLLALLVLYVAVVVLGQDVVGLFSRDFQDAPWSLAKVVDLLKHLWVPAIIGGVTGTAGLMRIMRGNLLDTLGQPFVEAARARGLKNRTVTWRHAVRMAINPLIVILGTDALPSIIGGNALVEIVLNLPTMGPLYINALLRQDMFMAGTVLVFIVLLLLVGSILADLALAWVDPRIRLE
ncbi:MAG: ABC transporter permease [Chloroflexi bacterium]|nr:ABC transporter permease [Chloroflexota bacterium]MCI0579692.1 ABC transporter permease [Chloroflexota bacterium]MCI0649579.1 ABC transporter permease [Chloroflexota bacterium]MCI0729345.1 ABC transporter permease [Chloroflexota bacterium]